MEMSNQHLAIFASFNLPDLFDVFSDSIKNLTACQQKWDKTWEAVSIMDVNMTTMTVGGMISGMITHQTGLHDSSLYAGCLVTSKTNNYFKRVR